MHAAAAVAAASWQGAAPSRRSSSSSGTGTGRRRAAARPLAAASAQDVAGEFAGGRRKVELIVTDVDGTLLTPQQQLAPATRAALHAAADAGVHVVIATGKALGPWTSDVLPHLGSRLPQVYLQGLLISCHDEGVLFEQRLPDPIVHECVEFAARHGVTLIAYCGDRVVCEARDEHTDRLLFYREPTPEGIGPLEPHVGTLPIYKMIWMGSDAQIAALRPAAQQQFAGRASLTAALSGMLEVLPLGASKGAGVAWLLQRLGVDPAACMALGDGENDVEMLRLCGLGVAMGNAGPPALAAADAITAANDADGVAAAIQRYVLSPRGLL